MAKKTHFLGRFEALQMAVKHAQFFLVVPSFKVVTMRNPPTVAIDTLAWR